MPFKSFSQEFIKETWEKIHLENKKIEIAIEKKDTQLIKSHIEKLKFQLEFILMQEKYDGNL